MPHLSDLLAATNIRERAIEVLLDEIERIVGFIEKEYYTGGTLNAPVLRVK